MKYSRLYILSLLLVLSQLGFGQNKEGFQFTDIKRLPTTSVKSQDRAGTCWAFATISFLESEIIRIGKDSVSLSPLYTVHDCYERKGDKYVRMHGTSNFSQGGQANDVLCSFKEVGVVPYEVYSGLNYGETVHAHSELEAALKGYLNGVNKNSNKRLSTAWKRGYNAVLNEYLGAYPGSFEFRGKEYTPKSFAQSTGLNMDDYVCITSFTHHPFYSAFALEIPDNWMGTLSYNVPLDEFMAILDNAIDKGYTVAWDADVSENGFTRDGLAIVPTVDKKEMSDAEIAKWVKMSKSQQEYVLMNEPGHEKQITQENRQEGFDNWQTTDDHLMHIVGKAIDQKGNKYFIVKNSWGNYGKYNGFLYASYPFVAYKTINYVVHKEAIPEQIAKKLGIR